MIGLLPSALCVTELVHRLRLYRQYGCKPFDNHVADGYFGIIYALTSLAAAVFIVGFFLAIRSKAVPRAILYASATVLTVCLAAAFCYMHHADILVTYSEFVKNMGP